MEEAEEEQREAEGADLWRPRSVDPCEKKRNKAKQSSAHSLGQVEQREGSDDKKLNFEFSKLVENQ